MYLEGRGKGSGVLENEQGQTRGGEWGGQNSGIWSERIFWMSPYCSLNISNLETDSCEWWELVAFISLNLLIFTLNTVNYLFKMQKIFFSTLFSYWVCQFTEAAKTCNFNKKRLWHRCFTLNFAKFLRTPFSQNSFWRLLLS